MVASGDNIKTIDSGVTMAASYDSRAIDMVNYQYCLFIFEWSGADATNAKLWLEVSDTGDAGTWEEYPFSEVTIDSASGSHYFDVEVRSDAFFRMSYTPGANTAGTFTIKTRAKAPA